MAFEDRVGVLRRLQIFAGTLVKPGAVREAVGQLAAGLDDGGQCSEYQQVREERALNG
jgi:hypothetical protein